MFSLGISLVAGSSFFFLVDLLNQRAFFFLSGQGGFAIELEDWSCHTMRGPLSMPVYTCKRRCDGAYPPLWLREVYEWPNLRPSSSKNYW